MPARRGSTKNSNISKRTSSGSNLFRDRFWHKSILIAVIFAFIFGGLGGYYLKSGQAATYCVDETLQRYDYEGASSCVADLQLILNNWNTSSAHFGSRFQPLTKDGDYGNQTYSFVEGFQEWQHLGAPANPAYRLTVDGVVGPNTWLILCDAAVYYHFAYDDAGCSVILRYYGMLNGRVNPHSGIEPINS